MLTACAVAIPPTATNPPAAIPPEATPEELAALGDPFETFLVHTQTPPKGAGPIPHHGPFFRAGISGVTAYAYDFASFSAVTSPDGGDGIALDWPVLNDGSLAGNVVYPGVELTSAQADRLDHLLRVAEAGRPDLGSRPLIRCFDPHHFFVFHDAEGRPLAELVVCFECDMWIARPGIKAMGGDSPRSFYEDERQTLRTLCGELRLPGCPGHEPPPDHDISDPWSARFLLRPSGVDPTQRLRQTTDEDRRRLCAAEVLQAKYPWRTIQPTTLRGVLAWGSQFHGIRCDDERTMSFLDWDTCRVDIDAIAARCDVTVGRVEQCERAIVSRVRNPCESPPQPAECAGLTGCTWGIQ